MWFVSLQIFGSRWGPYCNKIPSSWEAFWRWCPDAVYWCWLLEDQLWLDSGTLLFPTAQNEKKGGKGATNMHAPLYPYLFTPLCPNAFFYCLSFQKPANPYLQFAQAPWLWSCWLQSGHTGCDQGWAGREMHPWNRMGTEPEPHLRLWRLFNISFVQMHISWQCWGWPGIQTWSARGRAIILKCFYWSVDFLSPSFSSPLHPASLLKTHILSHTTKVF